MRKKPLSFESGFFLLLLDLADLLKGQDGIGGGGKQANGEIELCFAEFKLLAKGRSAGGGTDTVLAVIKVYDRLAQGG